MKKFCAFIVVAVLIISLLSGCGGGRQAQPQGGSGTAPSQDTITIKLAHASPATNDRLEASCQEFAKAVKEKTNGKIIVQTYPASQLGGEREELEGVQMGTIEMAALSSGPFPGIFPDIMVFDMPYLFFSREAAFKVLDGPVGQEILDRLLQKTGIRALAWGENGFRHFTNNVRPILKPEDLKGLKIRTMENPAHMAIVRTLGGDPTPMAFGEVYTALAQKTVDGQENPVSLITSMKFHEVQKYCTLDGHVYNPYLLIINDKFFQSLDADSQKALQEAAALWRDVERKLNEEQVQAGVKLMKDAGVQVDELTTEQKEVFRKATQPVYDEFAKQLDPALMEKVLKAAQEANGI
ncbi:DctP family TRAP transporter solute-binding subunit [Gelria sp. Kuro-4]|uniref:TRAP transporter substrate-binding protein n=1 Tax=Gelria sp. Kuro-4 TaxID=2796927 RepID=UPI001BEF8C7E|nr:DctP family TRAP transporter solute-binding subunit [Gelria sp. Kuro-4]BCV24822.1 periplasmic substrate-binding transporter [Gelria sp. Kuro-4]